MRRDQKKVKFMGITYDIILVRGSRFQSNQIGSVDFIESKIYISDSLSTESKEVTILHEVLHIISESLGIKLTEEQIEILGTGLFSYLTDNYKEII